MSDWRSRPGEADSYFGARAAFKVYSGRADEAGLVIFGNSTTLSALWDDARLESMLAAAGTPLRVVNLSTNAQHPGEALFLASAWRPRPGRVVLITYRYTSLRAPMPMEALRKGAFLRGEADSPSDWNRAQAQQRGVVERAASLLPLARKRVQMQVLWPLQRWAAASIYGLDATRPLPPAYDEQASIDPAGLAAQWDAGRAQLDDHFEANLPLARSALEALLALLEAQQAKVVFVAPPGAVEVVWPDDPRYSRRYAAMIDDLARRHGIDQVDLNPGISWSLADLGDIAHLNGGGRAKWSAALVDWARQNAGPPGVPAPRR